MRASPFYSLRSSSNSIFEKYYFSFFESKSIWYHFALSGAGVRQSGITLHSGGAGVSQSGITLHSAVLEGGVLHHPDKHELPLKMLALALMEAKGKEGGHFGGIVLNEGKT